LSDRRDLSFVLRVLGDYLDRKIPGQFTISWSKNSIMISYDQIQESFTPENLYDFGIHMCNAELEQWGNSGSQFSF